MVKKSLVSIRFGSDLADRVWYDFTLLDIHNPRFIKIPQKEAFVVFLATNPILGGERVFDLVLPYWRFLPYFCCIPKRYRQQGSVRVRIRRVGRELEMKAGGQA